MDGRNLAEGNIEKLKQGLAAAFVDGNTAAEEFYRAIGFTPADMKFYVKFF